jgi:hypothetical protein
MNNMNAFSKTYIHNIVSLVIVFFSIPVLSACLSTDHLISTATPVTSSPVITPTALPTLDILPTLPTLVPFPTPPPSPTPEEVINPKCVPEMDQIYTGDFYGFTFSNDGQMVYFKTGKGSNEWSAYNVVDKTIRLGNHDELLFLNNLWSIYYQYAQDRIYNSPSGSETILLKEKEIGTPQPPGPYVRDLITEIYTKDNKNDLKLIGKISGVVEDVLWSPGEDRAYLIMEGRFLHVGKLSPYWVWIVGLQDNNLIPAVKRSDEKISFLGTTFDGNWIIYHYILKPNLRMQNLYDGRDEVLPITSSFYVWPVDNERIIFIKDHEETGDYDGLYIYNLQSKEVKKIRHIPFRYFTQGNKDNVKLSPDLTHLVYLSDNGNKLNLINLCY